MADIIEYEILNEEYPITIAFRKVYIAIDVSEDQGPKYFWEYIFEVHSHHINIRKYDLFNKAKFIEISMDREIFFFIFNKLQELIVKLEGNRIWFA